MIHITEDKLKAAIQICLGGDSIYTEEREAKLVHDIKALSIADVISRFTKFKNYGTKTDGAIFYIDEDKLNKDHINQIRNYLDSREKKLKSRK